MRILLPLLAFFVLALVARAADIPWSEVQTLKPEQLKKAAANAVAQQRTEAFPPQKLEAAWTGAGHVTIEESKDWDADGDGKCLKVTVKDIPENHDHINIPDRIEIRFPRPVNLLEKATGFALWIKTTDGLSKDLRFGVHFKIEGTTEDPVVIADTPLSQKFGDNPQQVYIDWGYVFDHSVGVFKTPPKDFFTKVTGLDLTLVQKRLPAEPGVKLAPASGVFYIDGLQLVDFYDGSYDSDRFPKNRPINAASPIVSQGRTQQVAHLCAKFGGEPGAKSALRALDMMARIQCWEGSWPEMQTRLEGEWTHGMILADLSWTYAELQRQNRPELDEKVQIRQWNMPRRALYEQMLYRGARSRSPAPIHTYNDTYVSGEGALTGGCNRPMIFTVAQFIAAQVLSDPAQKKQILAEYDQNLNDLVAYQGKTAGGWPIFGEGDKYDGKGLHWDCGYTTDHVFIMAIGARVTNDKRWFEMMDKFDTVVTAMVLPNGYEIDGGLSERGNAKSGGLKAPDMVYQEALRAGAPALTQWAANESRHLWSNWPTGMWAYAGGAKGYGLGAFLTWQAYDLAATPAPADTGLVFPRQWPIWTAEWKDKAGKSVRKSHLVIYPDGKMTHDFAWEVGQYPVITGLPLAITAKNAAVEIEPLSYKNVTGKWPDPRAGRVYSSGVTDHVGGTSELKDSRFTVEVNQPTVVLVTFGPPATSTSFGFKATPQGADAKATLTCRVLSKPEPYTHTAAKAPAP